MCIPGTNFVGVIRDLQGPDALVVPEGIINTEYEIPDPALQNESMRIYQILKSEGALCPLSMLVAMPRVDQR